MSTLATIDDVLASVKRWADGNSTLTAALVGGWHAERPPASAVMPWAVAKCEETEWMEHSLGSVTTYRVTVEVRLQEGLHDGRAIARELQELHRYPALTLPSIDSRIVHCLQVPGSDSTESQQHQAREVGLITKVFDILVGHPLQYPVTAYSTTILITSTWTAPSNLIGTSVTVAAVGRGADGTDGTGGGGGAYATSSLTVTPGEDYAVTINSLLSRFVGDDASVIAAVASGATGGAAGSSTGTTKYSGGNGFAGNSTTAGGGGGAAGASGNGTSATNATGGAAGGSPGGAGGDGGSILGEPDGLPGSNYGGGGGGFATGGDAGTGSAGVVTVSGYTRGASF